MFQATCDYAGRCLPFRLPRGTPISSLQGTTDTLLEYLTIAALNRSYMPCTTSSIFLLCPSPNRMKAAPGQLGGTRFASDSKLDSSLGEKMQTALQRPLTNWQQVHQADIIPHLFIELFDVRVHQRKYRVCCVHRLLEPIHESG